MNGKFAVRPLSESLAEASNAKRRREEFRRQGEADATKRQRIAEAFRPIYNAPPHPLMVDAQYAAEWAKHTGQAIVDFVAVVNAKGYLDKLLALKSIKDDNGDEWALGLFQVASSGDKQKTIEAVKQIQAVAPNYSWAVRMFNNNDLLLRLLDGNDPNAVSAPVEPTVNDKPVWNRDTGKLIVAGELAKRVKNLGIAKNVIKILDVFQESGWPPKIDDPLPGTREPDRRARLGDAINSLNDGIVGIRFSRDGTAEGITWELAPSLSPPPTLP